jgi:hypothetical protein
MAYSSSTPQVRTLLQSVLHFGNQLLWCEVVSRGQSDYEVHVVPQSDMSRAVVEPCRRITDAIRRHAEVSWLLRESGWEPVVNSDTERFRPTAA